MWIDVIRPMLEIKGNNETRCNWRQPSPGSLSPVSLAENPGNEVELANAKRGLVGVL